MSGPVGATDLESSIQKDMMQCLGFLLTVTKGTLTPDNRKSFSFTVWCVIVVGIQSTIFFFFK